MTRHTFFTATALSTVLVTVLPATGEQMIDVPAQPLAEALKELGDETGIQVIAASDTIAGKTSNTVRGEMTPQMALGVMLTETGLTFRAPDANGAVLSLPETVSQNSEDDGFFDLGSIVLQGERVERDVFNTTSSVRAYGGEEIEQNVQYTDFEAVIESAANVITQGVSNNTPVIRGVDTAGVGGFISGQLPRATLTIDGRAVSTDEFRYSITSVWDVDTIEVFRGPQTTSLGENSIAGAINIRTRDPVFFNEGAFRVEAGDRDGFLGALMVNRALSESVALRFTYERQNEDGFINFPNGIPAGSEAEEIELTTARLKVRWEPESLPDLNTQLTFEYKDFSRPQTQIVLAPNFSALNSNNTDGFPSAFIGEIQAIVHDVEYAFGTGFAVRNQMQFSHSEIARVTGAPGPSGLPFESDDFTNELILEYAPDGGAFSGILGTYYQDVVVKSDPTDPIQVDDIKESRGVFGEFTYNFDGGFDFTAGVRYQENRQRRNLSSAAPPATIDYNETFDEWLPKLAIGYEPHDDLRFSFQVSRGFNPGGVSGSIFGIIGGLPDAIQTFEDETVTNYELAMRGRFFDQRLFVSANVFFSDFEDFQFIVPVTLTGGFVDNLVRNAQGVETYGLELDGQFEATEQVSITGAVGLLHTEVTSFAGSAAVVGNELPRAPKFNAMLGINYAVTDRLEIGGQVRHVGSSYSDIDNTAAFKVPDRTLLDIRGSYDVTDNAQVYFYMNNVFDEISPLFLFQSGANVAGATTEPREVGFGLQATF